MSAPLTCNVLIAGKVREEVGYRVAPHVRVIIVFNYEFYLVIQYTIIYLIYVIFNEGQASACTTINSV